VAKEASAELKVKNSRFVGTVCPVWSEGDAAAFLARMRAKYADASHNVFAYRVSAGGASSGSLLERQSDDGEPSGTGGKPVLDVLAGMGLVNVCANVTRYFGGTLLGTGGLARAYPSAARVALAQAEISEYRRLLPMRLSLPYGVYDKFMHTAGLHTGSYVVRGADFGEDVALEIVCAEDQAEMFRSLTASIARGAHISQGEAYYGVLGRV